MNREQFEEIFESTESDWNGDNRISRIKINPKIHER